MNDCPLAVNVRGQCQWCRKKLIGRQSRWCSKTCARTATKEHRWTQARQAARAAVAYYECARCEYLFKLADIQVNHIVPALGKHGVWGCHHHSTNLEVLCKECHLTTTAQQREQGLFQ